MKEPQMICKRCNRYYSARKQKCPFCARKRDKRDNGNSGGGSTKSKIKCPKCEAIFVLPDLQLARMRSFEACPSCQYRFFVNREVSTQKGSGVLTQRKGGSKGKEVESIAYKRQ